MKISPNQILILSKIIFEMRQNGILGFSIPRLVPRMGEPTQHAVDVMTSYRHFRIIAESYRTLYEDSCIQEMDWNEQKFPAYFQNVQQNSVKIQFNKYLSNCTSVGTYVHLYMKFILSSLQQSVITSTECCIK